MQISRGGFRVRNHAIVKVSTDEGLTGLGEGIGSAALVKGAIDSHFATLAKGLDPRSIESVRTRLLDSDVYFERMGSATCAASAIEMACWDIKAKSLGVPLCDLLGGATRRALDVYASNVYWQEAPAAMAAEAEAICAKGISAIKAHIGHADPDAEVSRVSALREAIGPEAKLMIDLNAGYTYSQALRACQLWEPFDIFWLEEPLRPEHTGRLPDLKRHTSIPIAAGENEFRTYGFKQLFDMGAVDIAMPDIGRVGGIQEAKNVCSLADAYGVEVSLHNYSSGVLLAATIHVMASTPNTSLLEFDASENAVYADLLADGLELTGGTIRLPEKPGLGVELSARVLAQYEVH